MHRIIPAIVLLGPLAFASATFADAQAKGIVEKAIRAQGGATKLAKLRTMRIKFEVTEYPDLGQSSLQYSIEEFQQMPNQYKSMLTFENKLMQTRVINENKFWIKTSGQEQDLDTETIAEMIEEKYASDLGYLAFLSDNNTQLSTLDTVKVLGEPAFGILVKAKGHRDVKLYFDKSSGFLVKRIHRIMDFAVDDALLEVVFSDYREKDGVMHYRQAEQFVNGKKRHEVRVTQIEFFKKLDAKVFAKP